MPSRQGRYLLHRFTLSIMLLLACSFAEAQMESVQGKVTYLSAGTIYASIGWGGGNQDSTSLFVVAKDDTVAKLRVIAVSSKSCACTVISQKRDMVIGDVVVGSILRTTRPD